MSTQQGNVGVIQALLAELGALGVEEFCVCAGARNAPLLDALAQVPRLTLRSFFEERSAAFFALGRIMQTRRPVAVVTTSGTAVAELFPAVMEAHYQALPLVVVTADRPARYRGSGAPQAVEQSQFFGEYTPGWCEIEFIPDRGCCTNQVYRGKGPVHINVRLEEGLTEGGPWDFSPHADETPEAADSGLQPDFWLGWHSFWSSQEPGLVLASAMHPSAAKVAAKFIAELGWPAVVEATANLHDEAAIKPLMLAGGESTLRSLRCGRILRLGGVPSWRWWRDLDNQGDVHVLNVTTTSFRGLARTVNVTTAPWGILGKAKFVTAGPLEMGGPMASAKHLVGVINEGLRIPAHSPPSLAGPQVAETGQRLAALLEANPHSEPSWMRHLSRIIGAEATVFLGNSLPIREWNLAADAPKRGTQLFANRGANGIDGLVSTWLGVGAESKESWLILGDLSALYDLGAPWILPQLRAAKRRIVIINNGGGKIFSRVSWLKEAGDDTKRMMENPHAISFEPWARLWGMDYRLLTKAAQLRECDDDVSCAVWEVRPDAGETDAFWNAWQK